MSGDFTKVARLRDLKTSKLMCVKLQGHRIALAYVDGKVFAIDDTCSHEDASLAKGSLHGECVKCPLHGSRFDLNTGAALDEPAEEPVSTHAVRVEGDDILVQLAGHDEA